MEIQAFFRKGALLDRTKRIFFFNKMVYSHVDCHNVPLEQIIDKWFDSKNNGQFVDVGANNGLLQSNTAFLEKERNWTGVLVEPSLQAFEACKVNRKNSQAFHCACVSSFYIDNFVQGDFQTSSLMASVNGTRLSNKNLVKVPARTLTSILDEAQSPKNFEFLSLDVEGYEFQVLSGLDFKRQRPQKMLIEVQQKDFTSIQQLLENNDYTLICNVTNYSKATNPHWDGTHNDYLFVDNLKRELN